MSKTIIHVQDLSPDDSFDPNLEPRSRLVAVQNGISIFCAVMAGLSLLAITLLTCVEVVTRSGFDKPLGWNVALVEQYFMMSMAFFGAVTAYHTGAHVAVATIYSKLPPRARKIVVLLGHTIVLLGFAALTWAGLLAAGFSFRTDEAPVPGMAELPLPTWWWKSIMPAACSLGVVVVALDIFRELTSSWDQPRTEFHDPLDEENL